MPESPGIRFLDPAVLRSIASLELKARLLVEGLYASRHRCPFYGYSVEFVDHREYTPGDEPRTIDWKMLARTERYFVKRFEMESNMNVLCLLDASGSMGYRGQYGTRLGKLEYACTLAAALCYLVYRQQDSPGLVTFDTAIRDFVPSRQGQRHLFTILARLDALAAGGETRLGNVFRTVAQRLTRRGIVVLISDGYGDPDEVIDGVRHLAVRGHDVAFFHLLDSEEVTFPFQALASFQDLETGVQRMSDPLRQRKAYLERFGRFREAIQSGCDACGAEYRFVDTAGPIERVLREYLLYRRKRGR
ncbi:MAG: DUF58 domain-containing protein [Planctomycetes bacterium]|nr:DUF58 domain-containing protein [Planctomycetota bacterium]